GLTHGCPVEQLGQCGIERRELQCNCKYLLPGLVPGTHVLTAEITKAQEDVDGRVKPGQGDLRLCMDRWETTGFPQPDSRGLDPGKGFLQSHFGFAPLVVQRWSRFDARDRQVIR